MIGSCWFNLRCLISSVYKGYKTPTDSLNCPFQLTFATKLPFFEYLCQNPGTLKDFNSSMARNRGSRKHWVDWFPVESQILSAISSAENDTLLVDVGGGKGHDLERLLSKYPETKGWLVLQDLPDAINSIEQLSPDIHPMSHNFFTPRPVRGKKCPTNGRGAKIICWYCESARAYYMYFIFRSWTDAQCRLILQNLMPAMKAGYSKILLNEPVLPNINCGSWFATADLNMMSVCAGMERIRKHWIDLLQSVGLEVVRIWSSPHDGEEDSVIEAMLKEG